MTRTAMVLIALLALTATARADTLRAGVPVDALTPVGMARVKIRAPLEPGLPVRLVYSASDRAEVLVDVVVAPDAAGARVALDLWLHQASRVFSVARTPIGDVTYSAGNAVVFTRANVMVAVRRVGGAADVRAIARRARVAIDRAPKRAGTVSVVRAAVPHLAVGKSAPLALSGSPLAVDVRATGPGHVRRTRAGWRVARTGAGDVAVRVIAVDALLRVTTQTTALSAR